MIKSWLLFIFEGIFLALVALLIAFIAIAPGLKKNIEKSLSKPLKMEVHLGDFFFSPTGRLSGKNLVLKGRTPALGQVEIIANHYDIIPQENLIFDYLQLNNSLNWKKISFEIKMRDLIMRSEKYNLIVSIPQLTIDKGESLNIDILGIQATGEHKNSRFDLQGASLHTSIDLKQKKIISPALRIKDFRLEKYRLSLDQKIIEMPAWRFYREEDDLIGQAQINFEGRNFLFTPEISFNEKKFKVHGEQKITELNDELIKYSLVGPMSLDKKWTLQLNDSKNNRLDFTLTQLENEWLGTGQVNLKSLTWPSMEEFPFRGQIDGGFGFKEKKLNYLIHVKDFSGGPKGTEKLYAKLEGSVHSGNLEVRSLVAGEENSWEGEFSGNIQLDTFYPSGTHLKVRRFPLTKYSPTVSGEIDITANEVDGKLILKLHADKIYPGKDPLQIVENLAVLVEIGEKGISFKQSLIQSGETNRLEAEVEVESILRDPLKVKKGVLKKFRSESVLFDLNLDSPVELSMNALEIDVEKFSILDRTGRFKSLRGRAHIPFFKASELRIEGEGELDMGKFPVLASSPVTGIIRIQKGVWDKGWSIKNLRANFKSQNLNVRPSAIFPPLSIDQAEGFFRNRTLYIDKLETHHKDGTELKAQGSYNFIKRKLAVGLQAKGLSYRKEKEYQLSYNLPNLRVEGDIQDLKISGSISINQLQYSLPVKILESSGSETQRPLIIQADARVFSHQLDLKILNSKPMILKNNIGSISFDAHELRINGPLENPRWTGSLISTTDPANQVTLPMNNIRIAFDVDRAQLKFFDDALWNPSLSLLVKKDVEDVSIYVGMEEKLNLVSEKEFQLSSSPKYSKAKILEMIITNRKVKQDDDFSTSQDSSLEGSTPSFQIKKMGLLENSEVTQDGSGTSLRKDFDLSPRLNVDLSARPSSESNSIEFKLSYELLKYMQLEFSQKFEEDIFMGFRFSKNVFKFRDFFDFEKLEDSIQKKQLDVIWDVKIEKMKLSFNERRLLEAELAKMESSVVEGQYAQTMTDLKLVLRDLFYSLGYPHAEFNIRSIGEWRNTWLRRNGERRVHRNSIKIALSIYPGCRYHINDTKVDGWPVGVEQPEDSWLNNNSSRKPLYDPSHIDVLKSKLVARLARFGYPAAKVIKVEALRIKAKDERYLLKKTSFVDESSFESGRFKNNFSKGMSLFFTIQAHEKHSVQRLVLGGVHSYTEDEILKSLSFKQGQEYREGDFEKYRNQLFKRYEEGGFFGTSIQYHVLMSRRYPRASLHFNIIEGERWRVGQILITGTQRTKSSYLKRVISLKEGQAANSETMKESYEKLYSLGLFSQVNLSWLKSEEVGKRDLQVTLKERPHLSLSTRLGYESSQGFQGSFRMMLENIAGKGRRLSYENNFTSAESLKKFFYEDPYALNRDLILQVILAQKIEIISDLNLENESYFLEGRLLKRWSPTLSSTFLSSYQEDKLNAFRLTSLISQRSRVPSIRVGLINDLRSTSAFLAPAAGLNFRLSHELISYLYGSGLQVYRGDYRLGYASRWGRALIVPWLRWAHSSGLGKSFDIPLGDRLFLGGPNSLRGFKQDDITGPEGIGGESLFASGIQFFYPLMKKVEMTLFYETGNVFTGKAELNTQDLLRSIGFGFLLRTPVGPLQFHYGQPLNDQSGRFGIQLGTIF